MSIDFSAQDLADAQSLLAELFTEVQAQESTLAGGTKLGIGATALQGLRETKVTFGNPRNHLIRLTPALFDAVGITLAEVWQRQMRTQFDFYYMTLTVSLQPQRGAQFGRVECKLEFESPTGGNEVIIQRIFPSTAWREVLKWGGEINLALNSELNWSAGVDLPAALPVANLPVEVQAAIANKNALKAFVTVPRYTFSLGETEIAATGEGNSECSWRIERTTLRETQTVEFVVVFKVPQGTNMITLTGLVVAEPSIHWLAENIRGVFGYLSEHLQAIFQQSSTQRHGKERLPIGDHEQWTLTLPR